MLLQCLNASDIRNLEICKENKDVLRILIEKEIQSLENDILSLINTNNTVLSKSAMNLQEIKENMKIYCSKNLPNNVNRMLKAIEKKNLQSIEKIYENLEKIRKENIHSNNLQIENLRKEINDFQQILREIEKFK